MSPRGKKESWGRQKILQKGRQREGRRKQRLIIRESREKKNVVQDKQKRNRNQGQ